MSRFLSRATAYIYIILLGTSCTTSFPGGVCDIDSDVWYSGVNQDVKLTNNDTISSREVLVFVKYTPALNSEKSLFSLKTTSPSGLSWIDTITLITPKITTKTEVDAEHQQSYRKGVILKESGDYRFRFTLISPDSISGINAVGISVN